MAMTESQQTKTKPRTVKVLMFTVTESLANTLFLLANIVLIAGAAAVLIGTIGAIAMGSAKEQFANERISANETETARAKADAETAKEGAAQANARALEAQVALEQFRAPRAISQAQQVALVGLAARHKNTALDIFMAGDSADIAPLADKFAEFLKQGGNWPVHAWTWTGVGPIHGIAVAIKPGASAASVTIANELVAAIDGKTGNKPQVWPGQWETFGGMLNGPPFDAKRTEIRLIIGSKPQ